jgi:hypothetical protein
MAKFKGTVLRDFFTLETTSCPIRHQDFKFLQFFFRELFVFVIDSLVYSPLESCDSPV